MYVVNRSNLLPSSTRSWSCFRIWIDVYSVGSKRSRTRSIRRINRIIKRVRRNSTRGITSPFRVNQNANERIISSTVIRKPGSGIQCVGLYYLTRTRFYVVRRARVCVVGRGLCVVWREHSPKHYSTISLISHTGNHTFDREPIHFRLIGRGRIQSQHRRASTDYCGKDSNYIQQRRRSIHSFGRRRHRSYHR